MRKWILRSTRQLRALPVFRWLAGLYLPSVPNPHPTEMLTLQPQFDEAAHSLYAGYLIAALKKHAKDAPRNIALTGAYGAGKSSVLQRVSEEFVERAITISLPTLGASTKRERTASSSGRRRGTPSRTNLIQKEIVKQLLYLEKPGKMRGSRYQRIAPVRWSFAIVTAIAIAGLAVVVLYLANALDRIVQLLPRDEPSPWIVYGAVFLFVVIVALVVQVTLHDRVRIQQVGSGPASITLSGPSSNYFDEYLDEIVYFFEHTRTDIVLFEDLDRFDNSHIFETLRELNTLLNNSKQLGSNRAIRFVYAIKDSIFDSRSDSEGSGEGSRQSMISNRTKFFDVVIPLVPFITHRSSASYITDILRISGLKIDPRLVDLVASHITDMRLIKNIHNEFLVFKQRVLSDAGVTGLGPDRLFAMVVYKNIALSDFEKIRTAESALDVVYRSSRELIQQNLRRIDVDIRSMSDLLESPNRADERARELGDALEPYIVGKFQQFGLGAPIGFVSNGITRSVDYFRTVEFWREMNSGARQLEVQHQTRYGATTVQFPLAELAMNLPGEVDVARWMSESYLVLQDRVSGLEWERSQIESATMKDLLELSYEVDPHAKERSLIPNGDALPRSMSYQDLVGAVINDELATEMLRGGFIDMNYVLYVSEYKDVHISASAMNYVVQFVQQGTADASYRFDSELDIRSLLDHVGEAALASRTLFNIGVFDYVLSSARDKIAPLFRVLSSWSEADQEFIGIYLFQGAHKEAFVRSLAHESRRVFTHIAEGIRHEEVAYGYLSAALEGASTRIQYTTSENLREMIANGPGRIGVLVSSLSELDARRVALVLSRLRVLFIDLDALDRSIRPEAIERGVYEVNATNLFAATALEYPSLDVLRESFPVVAEHALLYVDAYLDVVEESKGAWFSVEDPAHFLGVLEWVNKENPLHVVRTASLARPDCEVENLAGVSISIWGPLAETGRFLPSVRNVKLFIDEKEEIGHSLATFLNETASLQEPDAVDLDERVLLATLILNSPLMGVGPKVSLVKSLRLEEAIPASDILPQMGQLWGLLIREGIVADSADTFTYLSGVDSSTRIGLIANSKDFSSYLEHVVLSATDLSIIVDDPTIPELVRVKILNRYPEIANIDDATNSKFVAYAARNRIYLQSAVLRKMAQLGGDTESLFELLSIQIALRKVDNVHSVLVAMGGKFALLASPGTRPIFLPDNDCFRTVAEWLRANGHVSSIKTGPFAKGIRINMRHK